MRTLVEGRKGLLHLEQEGQEFLAVSGKGRVLFRHPSRSLVVKHIRDKQATWKAQGYSRFAFRDLGVREC